jgi:hypothetical protein
MSRVSITSAVLEDCHGCDEQQVEMDARTGECHTCSTSRYESVDCDECHITVGYALDGTYDVVLCEQCYANMQPLSEDPFAAPVEAPVPTVTKKPKTKAKAKK